MKNGEVVGVLLFLSLETNAFTADLVALLQRLADNIVFALENFDKADEKKQADERIQYLGTHDALTGLPNRFTFSQLLDASIRNALRYDRLCAVLFIDLDRFKIINDSLGHSAGDALLVEMARRLRQCVRDSDVVARLGGDEFVVLLSELRDAAAAGDVGRKILASVTEPLQLQGRECSVSASIGIAICPHDGRDEQMLTKHADMAMYLAKEEGKNDLRFFNTGIRSRSIENFALETNLRNALERNELLLHYQPKCDLITGCVTGVEALLRWEHPELGMMPPGDFIPLAEETGLIVPIGRWVLKTACAQSMAWQGEGLGPVPVAVNLSPRQFLHESLLDDIDEALASSGLAPELLELEITESMVMQNVERAISVLDRIKKKGVRLAIDDFGTGYSSMSLIKRFPIDTLKIDRSFVQELPKQRQDMAIAEAIINLGKALGLTIIAEGVETPDQENFLRAHECDEIQGFLLSRPVPPGQLSPLLRRMSVRSPALQPAMPEAVDTLQERCS